MGDWRAGVGELFREGLSEEITFELRPQWQIEAEKFPNLVPGNLDQMQETFKLGRENYCISFFSKLRLKFNIFVCLNAGNKLQ